MNNLDDIKNLLRDNLAARLPILMILVIGLGNVLFGITTLVPPLRAHEELVSQVNEGQKTLDDQAAQNGQQDDAKVLQAQIESAQTRLEKAASLFWTELQVNSILDRLYGYAEASGVKIINLQAQQQSAQPAQAAKNDAYDVRALRLQVEGSVAQLMNFAVRIREASVPTVNMTNINISKSETQNTLTMNLLIYTSPYASGEVFGNLPQMSTPTRVPPTATPVTPSPTPTPLPPTPTPLPVTPTFTPSPTTATTQTPTVAQGGKCNDQTSQNMRKLSFSQVQAASATCQTQVWSFSLDRSYEYVLDSERRSGNGLYRMELHDSSNNVVTTALSSIDGRGILVAQTGAGNYTLYVVPLTATGDWAYSIALWKGMPSLSFSFTQSSYSSHTSTGNRANVTAWRYVLSGNQSYRIEIVRTDGKLEYDLAVLDATKKPITSARSNNGNASVALTTGDGTYYVEVTALDGTTGSYRISLVP